MSSQPAISLLMNAYNRADYIGAAIGSILGQTRRDFELIIWDDGSTDNTLEVARRAASDDPRVKLIAGDHIGGVASINRAAANASAPYIGWVDSDDAITPNCLAETSAVLDARHHIGMVYSGYVIMNESGKVLGPGKRTSIPYSKDRLLTDFMTFQFRLMRREIFDSLGGMDESMPCSADYDLCLRLSEITQIEFINRPMYLYRIHDQSISQARRLDQIRASQHAIEKAIVRRGLSDQLELQVQLIGRFKLRRKSAAAQTPEEI